MAWSLARMDLQARRDALESDLKEIMVSIQSSESSGPETTESGLLEQAAREVAEQLRHIKAHLAVLQD